MFMGLSCGAQTCANSPFGGCLYGVNVRLIIRHLLALNVWFMLLLTLV